MKALKVILWLSMLFVLALGLFSILFGIWIVFYLYWQPIVTVLVAAIIAKLFLVPGKQGLSRPSQPLTNQQGPNWTDAGYVAGYMWYKADQKQDEIRKQTQLLEEQTRILRKQEDDRRWKR